MNTINAIGEAVLSNATLVFIIAALGLVGFLVLCVRINVSDRLTAARIRNTIPPEELDRLTSSRGRVTMDGESGPVDLTEFVTEARVSGAPLEPGKSPAYRDNTAHTDGDQDDRTARAEAPIREQGAEDGRHGPAHSVHPSRRPLVF